MSNNSYSNSIVNINKDNSFQPLIYSSRTLSKRKSSAALSNTMHVKQQEEELTDTVKVKNLAKSGWLYENGFTHDNIKNSAVIVGTNKRVDSWNKKIQQLNNNQEHLLLSTNYVTDIDDVLFEQSKQVNHEWDYNNPCLYCGFVFLKNSNNNYRKRCCQNIR